MNNILRCTIGVAFTLTAASLYASDSAGITAPLQNTGIDPDASGKVLASLSAKRAELIVSARNLDPQHTYSVEVGGIQEATFVTDKHGRGSIRFRTKVSGNTQPLDFDPRGKTLRILNDTASVLEAVISGEGEAPGTVVSEHVELEAEHLAGDDRNGHATVHFSRNRNGRRTFRVDVTKVAGQGVDVWVDGIERGHIELHGRKGSATFVDDSTESGRHDLSFDPRGKVVDVTRDDSVLFSSEAAAKVPGVNSASPRVTRVSIASTGADADGTASARLRIDDRARKHFSVDVEDVPAGAYDLLVDGVNAGTIQVAAVTGGTQGEIEFTSGDDDAHELPLTFDPAGKTLTIQQAGTVFFQGTFSSSTAGTPAGELPSQASESLASTGLDADASAKATFRVDDRGRHKFEVEIEDVPAGSYTLTVAGVNRGTINAQLIAGTSKVHGEIEFENEAERSESGTRRQGHGSDDGGGDDHGGATSGGGSGEVETEASSLPLNFDPRGQLIEIKATDGTYFSHLFGNGSAADGATTPFEVSTPLFNAGVDANATAEAKLRHRDDGSSRFEVEVEDVPAGAYDLLVGSVVRGTLNVVTTDRGTRGELEFEADDNGGTLTFDVLGQAISIQQGGAVFFSRTFPTQ